jgi:isopenicillin N synthase-like dioxygenase
MSQAASFQTAAPAALSEIPIIELGDMLDGLPGAAEAVGARIRAACMEYGFFFVRGHRVPQATIDRVFAVSEQYFARPLAEKLELPIDGNLLGYMPMGGSQTNTEAEMNSKPKPNQNESFFTTRELSPDDPRVLAGKMFRGVNRWPRNPPGFRAALLSYTEALDSLGKSLIPSFAHAFGVSPCYLEEPFAEPHISLRLAYYPNQSDMSENVFGVAPHTDFGFMTILATTRVPGLEIKPRGRDWIVAPALTDCFLVNAGDLLQRWTNDVFQSTPHRVINRAGEPRYSIPFFFRPAAEYVVDTMEAFVTPERPKHYAPITHAELFGSSVKKNYAHYQKAP